jgi:hypothetical protein
MLATSRALVWARWPEIVFEFEKARQRCALSELDDKALRDIGLTREQALEEARKGLARFLR